jgi:hypothetical protein
MMKRVLAVPPLPASLRVLFVCVLAASSRQTLFAQEIRIRVLNGNNGKAVTDECLNVWLGRRNGENLVAPTNKAGVAVLHFSDSQATADAAPQNACNRGAVLGPSPLPNDADAIIVFGDLYVACQEYGKIVPGEPATPDIVTGRLPSYAIKKILESGVSAGNTCGKFRAHAMPGELIFFVRPRHWWEALRL